MMADQNECVFSSNKGIFRVFIRPRLYRNRSKWVSMEPKEKIAKIEEKENKKVAKIDESEKKVVAKDEAKKVEVVNKAQEKIAKIKPKM
jgi:hypothetical protein